jgi:hypothetical protein
MLLPALGNIGIYYVAPLAVAKLVAHIAGQPGISPGTALPYVAGFAAVLLVAETLWRIGLHCLNRLDALGIEHLYLIGMDELLAKDAAFFHDNFAGSLTKRVLSFAARSPTRQVPLGGDEGAVRPHAGLQADGVGAHPGLQHGGVGAHPGLEHGGVGAHPELQVRGIRPHAGLQAGVRGHTSGSGHRVLPARSRVIRESG